MAKSNAQKCRDYRKRQPKALRVPLPEGTEAALNDLVEWARFTVDGKRLYRASYQREFIGRLKTRQKALKLYAKGTTQ